jgi:hypothetical protein
MQKLAKLTTILFLLFGIIFLPIGTLAQGGPTITIREPYCEGAGFSLGTLSTTFYDASKGKCVTARIFPYAILSEADPNYTASGVLDGLQPIEFPTFISVEQINNFSIWSWLSIIVSLIFILMIIFWVIILFRAGVSVIQSGGDPAALGKAQRRITNVLMGVAFLVGFFVVINLVAAFIGVGNFTEWPKVFSQCRDGQYYFNKRLSGQYANDAAVDRACF